MNSCNNPSICEYWFCNTKDKCLLDKQTSTPLRLKDAKNPKHNKVLHKIKKQEKTTLQNIECKLRLKWKHHPKRVVTLILNGHDAACACCNSLNDLTFDHIVPLSRGGDNSLKNGQILCIQCNHLKANFILTIEELRMIYEYIGYEPFERYRIKYQKLKELNKIA